jgi:hypothetical protein
VKPSPNLKRKLCAALDANDLDGVLAALDSVTRHLDNDPKARQVLGVSAIIMAPDLSLTANLIAAHLVERPRDLHSWVNALLSHEQSSVREVGVMLLPDLYSRHQRFVTLQLARFADDDKWIMRETAGGAAGAG